MLESPLSTEGLFDVNSTYRSTCVAITVLIVDFTLTAFVNCWCHGAVVVVGIVFLSIF